MYVFVAQVLFEIQQYLWKCEFSIFCVFVKKWWYHYTKTLKMQKLELKRRTIPHFKALDQLFWPLAWPFTRGSIIFAVFYTPSSYLDDMNVNSHLKKSTLLPKSLASDPKLLWNYEVFENYFQNGSGLVYSWRLYENPPAKKTNDL